MKNITLLKFKWKNKAPEIIGCFFDSKNALARINQMKKDDKYKNGEFFLSDRYILDS